MKRLLTYLKGSRTKGRITKGRMFKKVEFFFNIWEGRKFSNFYKKIHKFKKNILNTAFLGWIQHGEVCQLCAESTEEKNIDWRPEIWI